MRRIEVPLGGGRAYPVWVGRGLLGDPQRWDEALADGAVAVVSNEVVAPLYLETVLDALGDRTVTTLVLADGERHKTLGTWQRILDHLAESGCRRDTTVVALGGGVVGDMAGFAAASWMRGVRCVQAPTTLLAQVDASVGGKTGVNHPSGKNLVGAFHQPATVLADVSTLETLPAREYRAGLAEVVKYGAIRDAAFLETLETSVEALARRDEALLEAVVERSVRNKAEVVAADERERGERALLNFGHSFAHALETATGYERYLHGEAVAIGMVVAARLSEARGLCDPGIADRLERLLSALGLPVRMPGDIASAEMLERMSLDKKAVASGLRLVLLEAPGRALVVGGSAGEDIRAAIDACR